MLAKLTRVLYHRRRWVLLGSLVFLVGAVLAGGGVAEDLTTGGFEDPSAESTQAATVLAEDFGVTESNLVLVVTAAQGTVDDPAVAAAATELVGDLAAEPTVGQVVSYWTLPDATPLRSDDGRHGLVLATIEGDDDAVDVAAGPLVERFTVTDGPIRVAVGGEAAVFAEVGDTIESDLTRAELISLPITLLLLVLIFGSLVAASLPLGLGILSVLGTFAVLAVVNRFTDVSVYALNLTTALGLGLAIDYALFVVSRFREERHAGWGTEDALVRTMQTAGRTVLFSAVTVAVSLAALLVFPLAFLRSFAWAGMAVVALAALGSIIVLPALLGVLGPRLDGKQRRHHRDVTEGFWHGVAERVMRRPVLYGLGVLALLLLLGLPFAGVRFGQADDRVLPEDATSREAQDTIRSAFSSREASALDVVLPGVDGNSVEVADLANRISGLDGVARVDSAAGSFSGGTLVLASDPASPITARFLADSGTWLSVVPGIEPLSAEGEDLVAEVRSITANRGALVGGPSAELVDSKDALFGRLPLALGLIAVVTFVVMFLLVGSVLVPLKALVLNLVSLSATFGTMVWIFQDGHLSGLLGFTSTGTLELTMPILMFCIAFGLSMDYEVFLLSRIKEEYDRTGNNERAVAVGLERTGSIVTAAAGLLAFVFLAFATSNITFIKMFGLGLAIAVVMDATLVRGILVPAFMRLAGSANWWAPAPMRRLFDRLGLAERELDGEPPLDLDRGGTVTA